MTLTINEKTVVTEMTLARNSREYNEEVRAMTDAQVRVEIQSFKQERLMTLDIEIMLADRRYNDALRQADLALSDKVEKQELKDLLEAL